MKEMNFEEMEKLNAGSNYCDTLERWIDNGGEGYQGNYQNVLSLWGFYCK